MKYCIKRLLYYIHRKKNAARRVKEILFFKKIGFLITLNSSNGVFFVTVVSTTNVGQRIKPSNHEHLHDYSLSCCTIYKSSVDTSVCW